MSAVLPAEVAAAVEPGHDFHPDAVADLTVASRWTCGRCGRAVLVYGTTIYGGATEKACTDDPEEVAW